VVASSDDFYAAAPVLNRPGRARSMGEGWETRRRRGARCDYVGLPARFPRCCAQDRGRYRVFQVQRLGRGGPLRL
jgi:hypothetical protein